MSLNPAKGPTFIYFAYGSNMSTARLRKRAPSCSPMGVATLPGYQLKFHKRSKDGSAKCDAFRTGNSTDVLYGVLFEIANGDKPALDLVEGLGHGYTDEQITVSRADGSTCQAHAYIASPDAIDESLHPTDEYRQHVLDGAREHGLPDDYTARFITGGMPT